MSAAEIASLVYAACALVNVPFVLCVAGETAMEERRQINLYDALTVLLLLMFWPVVFVMTITDVFAVWRMYKDADKGPDYRGNHY